MNSSNVFLALSLIGLIGSTIAYFRLRLPGPLMIFEFLTGWIVGELALQVFIVQAIGTFVLIQMGALELPAGQGALGVTLLSWGLLGGAYRRGVNTGDEFRAALAPLGITPESDVSPFHGLLKPFGFRDPAVRVVRNIEYG